MTKLLFCSLRKKLIVLFSFLNMFSRCSQKSGIYIHEIFKPSLCKYGTRSQMALDIPLRKINTGQKSLSVLGPKIWFKIGPTIKNVRTPFPFMHAIKNNILLHLQN